MTPAHSDKFKSCRFLHCAKRKKEKKLSYKTASLESTSRNHKLEGEENILYLTTFHLLQEIHDSFKRECENRRLLFRGEGKTGVAGEIPLEAE